MAKIHILTPAAYRAESVFISGIIAMVAIFAIDMLTPPTIRLHMLYTFPIAAIAMHCPQRSRIIAGLVLSVIFQFVTFLYDGIQIVSLVVDGAIAFLSALLAIFLARTLRKNYLATIELASTDGLTGLLNRRSFETIANLEIERLKRYGGVFSLALLDLDRFKRLNDSRGHHAGDMALQLLATILREKLRHTDTIARIGGDEFVILMPNTTAPECGSLCQHLSVQIADQMAASAYPVTASIGCTTYVHAPESMSAALQKADRAMYAAKTGGKNRVVCI
ncbi:MAG: GGDEF domain-containing protein [Gallionella sp.]